jgi:3-dehydrotetronate 4-kinase
VSLIFGAIADDLTGGLELAAMIRAGGVPCAFATDLPERVDGPAIVVARRTRVADPVAAVEDVRRVGSWLADRGARQVFFKYCATFDSTPAGNIGNCADVLRDLTGSRLAAFCPSFPEVGRRVFQGHLFADDRLISESPKKDDPLTPMTDPDLVRVLQRQTRTPVGLIPHQVVRAGLDAMSAHCGRLVDQGIGFALADAAEPDDLQALAALTVSWPLMTGGSSVAAYYPALWRQQGLVPPEATLPPLPRVEGPGVVLAGSCAERTRRQLEVFGRYRPVLKLDLLAMTDAADAVAQALAWARPRLQDGPVAIATSAEPPAVAEAQKRHGQRGAASLAEAILSRLSLALCDEGVTRFLIAGGETSGAVLDHLGIRSLRVGRYRAPGIAQAVSDGSRPLAFCLKSGKLGPEDMFLPMLESLEEGECG